MDINIAFRLPLALLVGVVNGMAGRFLADNGYPVLAGIMMATVCLFPLLREPS